MSIRQFAVGKGFVFTYYAASNPIKLKEHMMIGSNLMDRRAAMKCLVASIAIPVAVMQSSTLLAGPTPTPAAAGAVVGDDKLVKAEDVVAKALKYNSDGAKSLDRKDARTGVAAKDQFCTNCSLYAKQGKLKSGEEVGKCTMIQSGLVKGNGWCNSWAKKA